MTDTVLIYKSEASQFPIPTIWRNTFCSIADAIKANDFQLINSLKHVRIVSALDANRIRDNIEVYGCQLASLPENTWKTSVCQWYGN